MSREHIQPDDDAALLSRKRRLIQQIIEATYFNPSTKDSPQVFDERAQEYDRLKEVVPKLFLGDEVALMDLERSLSNWPEETAELFPGSSLHAEAANDFAARYL